MCLIMQPSGDDTKWFLRPILLKLTLVPSCFYLVDNFERVDNDDQQKTNHTGSLDDVHF